ncbi:MAG: DUF3179 domain-containing protein [Haliscomenobacter sp.]|uniref:DUF3179 domain-containing protein n=1 Tax=Haliscomenobacter sp. TaxID=2717303 RepID=UPI0029A0C6C7|nr:DUF3179 domain-containing protein [Haliscomenobacter sp.]MDX2069035.1 DUF3179 domain-containing protein [Haliscomenobacter sp.]
MSFKQYSAIKGLLFCMVLSLIQACSPKSEPIMPNPGASNGTPEWLVPKNQVLDGGPGIDGIPSIDEPIFGTQSFESLGFMGAGDFVLMIKQQNEIRAYPVPILDWHEIVNDDLDTLSVAINYCPLTGTGIGWNRKVEGVKTTFGVSGLLYNSNLMPYDRSTESIWSQIKLQCVNGRLIGKTPKTITLIETTASTWQKMYPNFKILTGGKGRTRPYGTYPYGDFKVNQERLIFPADNSSDNRFPKKERLLGIIHQGDVKVVPFKIFPLKGIGLAVRTVGGEPTIVIGSNEFNFMCAYFPKGNKFEPVQDRLPIVMKDANNNFYDIFGQVVEGPNKDALLKKPDFMMGYWFAWAAFYPDLDL